MLIKSNSKTIINSYLDNVFDALKIGVIHLNHKNKIINISKWTTSLFGYSKSNIMNKSIYNLFNNDDESKLNKTLNKTNRTNIANNIKIKGQHENGKYLLLNLVITKIIEKKEIFIFINELMDKHENINNLIQLAYNDQLTQVPNLTLFMDRAKITRSQSKRQKLKFAILYLDIDDFKKINDNNGHFAGDVILKKLSLRLKNSIRESDTVARIGGDEFLILLQNITSKKDISIVIKRIFNFNKEQIKINGTNILINISLGISIYPDDSQSINKLIKNADKAMYKSKNKKTNNFMYYENNM